MSDDVKVAKEVASYVVESSERNLLIMRMTLMIIADRGWTAEEMIERLESNA